MYQAAEAEQGLIPWNDKPDNLIDRFDGRALLDFIREYDSSKRPVREPTDEEEELEDRVNFERYRDLVKLKRKGLTDIESLAEVEQELAARAAAPVAAERPKQKAESTAGKGTYGQVAFSYGKAGNQANEESDDTDEDDDDEEADEEELSSEDSEDEKIEQIGQEHGIESYNRLVFLERKAKEEEKKQKEQALGDPSTRKLSRKERRKLARQGKDSHYDVARRPVDLPRERRGSPTYEAYPRYQRERSRSRSPLPSRRERREHEPSKDREREKGKMSKDQEGDPGTSTKIEFITTFDIGGGKSSALPPPSSPTRARPEATSLSTRSEHWPLSDQPRQHRNELFAHDDAEPGATSHREPQLQSMEVFRWVLQCVQGAEASPLTRSWLSMLGSRPGGGPILEALRVDPAATSTPPIPPSSLERRGKEGKSSISSTSAALAKLSKTPTAIGQSKGQAGKKETPQERLKRIMSNQLNKQIKKDVASEEAKRRSAEELKRAKLEESRRAGHSYHRARSRSWSPRLASSRKVASRHLIMVEIVACLPKVKVAVRALQDATALHHRQAHLRDVVGADVIAQYHKTLDTDGEGAGVGADVNVLWAGGDLEPGSSVRRMSHVPLQGLLNVQCMRAMHLQALAALTTLVRVTKFSIGD
eukprot:SM000052S17795  [mRNA]  locus=s52:680207:684370:- [translate_table: standard]